MAYDQGEGNGYLKHTVSERVIGLDAITDLDSGQSCLHVHCYDNIWIIAYLEGLNIPSKKWAESRKPPKIVNYRGFDIVRSSPNL